MDVVVVFATIVMPVMPIGGDSPDVPPGPLLMIYLWKPITYDCIIALPIKHGHH